MCSQLLTPPNKSQTLRHSLYGNSIFLCKTPYGESNGLLGIIHHNVEELQQKLEKNELKTDLIADESELETKAAASKVRVLIVQDPISKVLSAFADEYKVNFEFIVGGRGSVQNLWSDIEAGLSLHQNFGISHLRSAPFNSIRGVKRSDESINTVLFLKKIKYTFRRNMANL